jgi:hypothetical protein
MTLPRYHEICEHWRKVPPVALTAAAIARYFGAIPAAPPPAAGQSNETDEERVGKRQALMDLLGGADGFKQEKPKWLTTST